MSTLLFDELKEANFYMVRAVPSLRLLLPTPTAYFRVQVLIDTANWLVRQRDLPPFVLPDERVSRQQQPSRLVASCVAYGRDRPIFRTTSLRATRPWRCC